MKAAFTEWHGRVAPVFDVAQTALMVETEMSGKSGEQVFGLPLGSPEAKVTFLVEHAVGVLVCGAISRHVRDLAETKGIQVYPFVVGDVGDIVDAWIHGRLDQFTYSMPGCHHRHPLRERSGRNNK